jgi:transposase
MSGSPDRRHDPDYLNARILPRAVAIALVRRGASYADAAREVSFTREAVREWSDDRAGLLRPQRVGKPRSLPDDQVQELDDILETAEAWRLREVEAIVAERFQVRLTLEVLMRLLRLLGYETKHWRWFRTPRRVSFREQREAAQRKNDAAIRERVAAITAHMHASGFSVDEIVGLLGECGARGPDGRPLGPTDVTRILAKLPATRGG